MPRPRAADNLSDADLSLLMALAGWTFPRRLNDTFTDTRFLKAPDGTLHRIQRLEGGISNTRVAFNMFLRLTNGTT